MKNISKFLFFEKIVHNIFFHNENVTKYFSSQKFPSMIQASQSILFIGRQRPSTDTFPLGQFTTKRLKPFVPSKVVFAGSCFEIPCLKSSVLGKLFMPSGKLFSSFFRFLAMTCEQIKRKTKLKYNFIFKRLRFRLLSRNLNFILK